jgi:hypothetical protein
MTAHSNGSRQATAYFFFFAAGFFAAAFLAAGFLAALAILVRPSVEFRTIRNESSPTHVEQQEFGEIQVLSQTNLSADGYRKFR